MKRGNRRCFGNKAAPTLQHPGHVVYLGIAACDYWRTPSETRGVGRRRGGRPKGLLVPVVRKTQCSQGALGDVAP